MKRLALLLVAVAFTAFATNDANAFELAKRVLNRNACATCEAAPVEACAPCQVVVEEAPAVSCEPTPACAPCAKRCCLAKFCVLKRERTCKPRRCAAPRPCVKPRPCVPKKRCLRCRRACDCAPQAPAFDGYCSECAGDLGSYASAPYFGAEKSKPRGNHMPDYIPLNYYATYHDNSNSLVDPYSTPQPDPRYAGRLGNFF